MKFSRNTLRALIQTTIFAIASAWTPSHLIVGRSSLVVAIRTTTKTTPLWQREYYAQGTTGLFMTDSPSSAEEPTQATAPFQSAEIEKLSDSEFKFIQDLFNKANEGDEGLEDVLTQALPTIPPNLVMKLRQDDLDEREEFQALSKTLQAILDTRLNRARDTLQDLLEAGEIRKLDALIGKAARESRLDVPFFQVLNLNMQDAAQAQEKSGSDDPLKDTNANRFQILKHIYTRCQEEVEKTIPPGIALLNKVMRTEQSSIRSNQLNHYLCPQPNVIKTPDGKELTLEGRDKVLVEHKEFVAAIADAVKQIRTVEKSGGASPVDTANMVEMCRQVAREARITIGEHYGEDSQELRDFESDLQPVFRPSGPESPYIQGVSALD